LGRSLLVVQGLGQGLALAQLQDLETALGLAVDEADALTGLSDLPDELSSRDVAG
jgi:hypothetical protein